MSKKEKKEKKKSFKDFTNQDDVDQSKDLIKEKGFSFDKISLEKGNNFLFIISSIYFDGNHHYIKGVGKKICFGDTINPPQKGWYPKGCPPCKKTKDLYADAKDKDSEKTKEKAGDLKSSYSACFVAVNVERVKIKGKKEYEYEIPEDVKLKVLQLSDSQFNKMRELPEHEDYKDFIKSNDDIFNRVLNFYKPKKSKQKYPAVEIKPDEEECDFSIDDFDKKEVKELLKLVKAEFTYESDEKLFKELKQAMKDYEKSDDESDEEEDFEESDLEENDDDLEDIDEDDEEEDDESKKKKKKSKKEKSKKKKKKKKEDDDEEDLDDEDEEDDKSKKSKKKKKKKDKDEDDDEEDFDDDDFEDFDDEEDEDD